MVTLSILPVVMLCLLPIMALLPVIIGVTLPLLFFTHVGLTLPFLSYAPVPAVQSLPWPSLKTVNEFITNTLSKVRREGPAA